MPANIEERNFNLIFVKLCRRLSRADNIEVRGLKTNELKNVSFMLKDPTNCVCTALKPVDRVYLFSELLWYLSGDTSSKVISLYASLWKEISDAEGQVNSNYGYTLFHENQFAFMIDMLSQDRYSRKAVASLNLPEHKLNMKDFPCTMYSQFFLRNGYLNMTTYQRSCDVIKGLVYDIPWSCHVMKMVLEELNKIWPDLDLGEFHHVIGSLHLYEKDFELAKRIIQ